MIDWTEHTDVHGNVFLILGSITLPELAEPFLFSVKPVPETGTWQLFSFLHQPPVQFPTYVDAMRELVPNYVEGMRA